MFKRTHPVAGLAFAMIAATAPAVMAQPAANNLDKIQRAVTVEAVRAHQQALQQIADSAGGNRFAGTSGHDRSVDYVVSKLRDAGYSPQVHEFSYPAFYEQTPTLLQQVSPTATTYTNGNDFRVMAYSGSGDVTAPVAIPAGNPNGCTPADFAGFPAGSIALVVRGVCTFRAKTDNATAAGAAAVLIYNNAAGMLNGTLSANGLSAIPSVGLTQALGQQLASTGGLVMRVRTDTADEVLATRNVIAETPKGDHSRVVMVGAHLDSVATGPGINDNGSGSAAILETAIQMAKVTPRQAVRFAWWSAEESGLVGSTRYVQSLSQAEQDKIALYLNFDMIGSPNPVRFVYDGDNSGGGGSVGPAGSEVIEQVFVDHFSSHDLASAPTPFSGRSDYGPFIAVGIPSGGLFTGAEGIKTAAQAAIFGGVAGQAYDPCYHAACDSYSNVDVTVLDQMSDAVAAVTLTFAMNTSAIDGAKSKGNFKGDSGQGGATGTGSGSGGLHDDHELEEI